MWTQVIKRIGKVGVIFLTALLVSYFFLPIFDKKEVVVKVPQDTGLEEISHILGENKVVVNPWLFSGVVKLLGWEAKLKAGLYEFSSPNLISVLRKLKQGQVKLFKVTIPEGLPKWRIAELLTRKGVVDAQGFLEVVDHPELFLKDFSWLSSANSLEGYLFPETYYFPQEGDPQEVARGFLTKFEENILPLYQEGREENSFSLHQIVILASIVEKEAQVSSEKPMIAAVFYNRLKRGMRLRADPTVKYALGSFRQRLSRKMLSFPSGYNTYLYPGLPPGPICSPGVKSIRAVLHPAEVDYLYFVAKGDGTHKFSQTYKEHLRAVNIYQRG